MTERSSWTELTAEAKRRLLEEKLHERAERSRSELPLSPGQRALWLVHQLAPESPAYNVTFGARILSPVDARALQAAFQGLADRHPALRATFSMTKGEVIAKVAKKHDVPFEVVNASSWPDEELAKELRREGERPFDLERGAVRVRFYEREPHPFVVATFHHIVMDGWSLWVYLSELPELYQAAREGRAPRLAKPQRDFRDFVRGQAELIASLEGERQRDFWLEELGGELPVLNLPADRTRPPTQNFRGDSFRFEIDDAVSQKLNALVRSEGATVPMGLLALYQILLFRYTRQAEFPIGTLSSGRTRADLEDVVGYLANPMVLRARVDEDASFRAVLRRTREAMLRAFDHQDYPFPLLVDALSPGRDPSRSPLFQVLFVFEQAQRLAREGITAFVLGETDRSVQLGELCVSPLPFPAQHEGQFDLILLLTELDGRLAGYFDYSQDLFERETIARLAGHFLALARSAVGAPDEPLSKLALLTAEERRELLAWNDTAADYRPSCLHELFEAHAARDPAAIAATFEGVGLSYRALNERANALAHSLRELGVGPEVGVAVTLDRSLALVVGFLGILKAGGAYVPIDPAYPDERRSLMLEDSGALVVLTETSRRESLAGFRGRVLCLDGDAREIGARPTENLVSGAGPSSLAYIIYTSGSTGRPKGVLVEHRGLSTIAFEQRRLFGVGPGWRVLQFSSISFDASIFEMILAFGSGASLHLKRQEALLPGRPLLEMLESERISIVTLPPSALMNLPAAPLPALRVITVAGEACPAELPERWAGGRKFFNLYGPTEATIWSTFAECGPSPAPPPIGRPIANTQVFVLDASGHEAPVGVPGELHVGGRGLARGYLHQPRLTAEKFVASPLPGREGERLYRTGDLARRRPDGDIEFLGRLDFQVKVRGFRIELGEIERVLGTHPDVNEVQVVVRTDPGRDPRLVAYVVPRHAEPLSPGSLRSFLKRRLPEFMVPAAFVPLSSLPLTPSGKVDRSALPAPEAVLRPAEDVERPEGELEETIASLWRELLKLDRVGVHDNFFEIGGNSLLITRANAKLEAALGREVPLVDMFRYPTIRALARSLEREGRAEPAGSRAEALASGRERLREQRSRRQKT